MPRLLLPLLCLLLLALPSRALLSPLLPTCSQVPSSFAAGSVITAGFSFTPGKSVYCATDSITGACLKGIAFQVQVDGFVALPVSCDPPLNVFRTWTSVKIPFSAGYSLDSGSSAACPSSSSSDASTYQGKVALNVCLGGTMYVDQIGHPATVSLSYSSNNNVDQLFFSTHLSIVGQANAILPMPFCLPLPLLSAPLACALKNLAGVLTDSKCGTACTCTSWELLKISASLSLSGGVALSIKVCNYCPTPIDYLAMCIFNLANLNLDLGAWTSPNGRQWNISLDAGLTLLPLCGRNLRYYALNRGGMANGSCDTITLTLGGWTPSFQLGVHAKLLDVGVGIESQILNVVSCPPIVCKTPTLRLPYLPALNVSLTASVAISAAISLSIPGAHPAATIASVSASVLLTLGCTLNPLIAVPWIISLLPLRATVAANDNSWYPLDPDAYQGVAIVPNVCLLGSGTLYIKAAAQLSATLTANPLGIYVSARVRLAIGGIPAEWSNVTVTKPTLDLDCPDSTTSAPPLPTLAPTASPAPTASAAPTPSPDPSASPAPSDAPTPTPSDGPTDAPTAPPATYTPPDDFPVSCALPGYLPPFCVDCLVAPAGLTYTCLPDGTGGYSWTAVADGDVTASSAGAAVAIGGTTPDGYELDCACQPIFKPCPAPCAGAACVCSSVTGLCVADAVCDLPVNNTDCDACPLGANGLECSGHGVCDCGVCRCGAAPSAPNDTYTGDACGELPKTKCDHGTCEDCALDAACSWCASEGGKCQAAGSCPTAEVGQCDVSQSVSPPTCPNNCSGHGKCVSDPDSGITQCDCHKGFHAVDCSASGGVTNKAAIISGAVVAGIVLGSLAGLGALAYGTKKGLDYTGFTDQKSRQLVDNPAFQDRGLAVNNAAFDA